jgi:cystathionine beta-lyase
MHYDFDSIIDRRGTGAAKWAGMSERWQAQGVLPMSVADMEIRTPPCVVEAAVKAAQHGIYGYTVMTDEAKAAVVDWMARRHDWLIQADWILQSTGIVPALYSVVRAFTQPGDGVLIQTPAYPPFFSCVRDNGRALVENPLRNVDGRYEMDFDDLQDKLARPDVKVMILCSPHNPTGRVWTREELERVSTLCLAHDVLLVSDEIHFDLIAKGQTHTVLASINPGIQQRCIVCTALSKTFNVPGIGNSNLIVPNEGLRKALACQLSLDGCGSTLYFSNAITVAAYRQGEAWLEELLDHIQGNYDALWDVMRRRFPQAVVSPREGTYLAWVDLRFMEMTHEELTACMEAAGCYLGPGADYGPRGQGFARVNLAMPRRALVENLERFADVCRQEGYTDR